MAATDSLPEDKTLPPTGEALASSPALSRTQPEPTEVLHPGPHSDARSIPGYEILEEIAHGGMGVVYKARQISLHRVVALKMILAGAHAGAQDRARFLAEAEAVALLQHPNIVQIHEIGEHNACPFFSLEYVAGGTLGEKIHGVPQPPRPAAYLVLSLARAIHHAHQHGIIHRDLKPGNILLEPAADNSRSSDSLHREAPEVARLYGIPKITDFGLAKHLGQDLVQTQTGDVLGTPSYMSPEQADGRIHAMGPATDVYALGAILYELLTGKPPFRGTTAMETLCQVVADDPVRPTSLQRKVPVDLETICLKCLHKDPQRRYASAEALAEDLTRFLDGQPIAARPIGYLERLVKWARRRPAWAALLGVSTLAGIALLLGGLHYNLRLKRALEVAEQNAEESRRNLVRLHVVNGTSAMDAGSKLSALVWLTEAFHLDEGHADQELIHRTRIATALRQCPKLVQLWVHEGSINGAHFSPDGRFVATACDDGRARVWNLTQAEGKPIAVLEHEGAVTRVLYDREGKQLATASRDGTACVWDPLTGKRIAGPLRHGAAVTWVAFSPDGRWLLSAGGDRTVKVWETATATLVGLPLTHQARVHQASFSPDGRRIVGAGSDGTAPVWYWDTKTWEALHLSLRHQEDVLDARFSPDGLSILTASADHTACVWDAKEGTLRFTLRHDGPVVHAAFGPQNRRIVTASEDHTARVWSARTGELLVEPLKHRSGVRYAGFSPDATRIVTASDDNMARVWSAMTGKPLTPTLRHNGTVSYAAFSPIGRQVVTASDDGTVRVWDGASVAAAHGEEWAKYTGPDSDSPARALLRTLTADLGGAGVQRARNLGNDERAAEAGVSKPTSMTSPDGRRVIRLEGGFAARVYDARSGSAFPPLGHHRSEVRYAAFSPDAERVVTCSDDGTARIWEVASGELVGRPLQHASRVNYADFSPDGLRIVTASDDDTARLWDARTGEPLLVPLNHHGTVVYASFSPDGLRIATASKDRTAVVWDSASGQPICTGLVHPWTVRQAVFSSQGDHLVTTGPGGTRWMWDLRPDERPLEDLRKMAQMLAGHRIDEKRDVMPLDPVAQRSIWQTLRERYPESFEASPEEVQIWHRTTMAEHLRNRQWEAAVWHLDRLIAEEPEDVLLRALRGVAQAEQGHLKEASADFAQAAEKAPGERQLWCLHALLCLAAKDSAGYRRACQTLLALPANDARDAYLDAWICVLAPEGVTDPRKVVQRAEQALASSPPNPDYLATLGGALVRAGQIDEAVRRLNDAMAQRRRSSSVREWLLLALARQRLGHTGEAQLWLERADRWLEDKSASGDSPDDPSFPWHRRLYLNLLHREVEATLKGSKVP
jgi:WD40 repeat protein/Flp pilus assembly protein TadD